MFNIVPICLATGSRFKSSCYCFKARVLQSSETFLAVNTGGVGFFCSRGIEHFPHSIGIMFEVVCGPSGVGSVG